MVRTDHSPLLWLRNNAGKSTRIARWVLRLQDFAFDLQHKAGRCNAVADALSRYPTGEAPAKPHDTMCESNRTYQRDGLCAVVDPSERCRSCWGQHNAFLAGGGAAAIRSKSVPRTAVSEGDKRPDTEAGQETIRYLQKSDAECIEVRQYMAGIAGARLPSWALRANLAPTDVDGVLCLKSTEPQHHDKAPLILLPQAARIAIVQRMHLGPEAGHFGRKKTLARIRNRYVWGTMARDVAKVLRTCSQCWQQAKDGARMLPYRTLPRGWPGEVIAMDLFGPLPVTRTGFSLILVIVDHFSRWVDLTALRRAEALDVVNILKERWIPQHGVPRLILSDNGPQFIAEILERLCKSIGARKIFSTPYHPQGNSVVESFMRTLKKALGALVDEDGKDWDRHLQAVALAHNSTPHTATGFSPFFLEHGREAVLPVQRFLDEPRLDPLSVAWLARLWRARAHVYEAHARQEQRQREQCGSSKTVLPKGAIVAVRLSPADIAEYPAKVAPKWAGPWVVVEKFTNDKTYRVQDVVTKAERQVTRDQLKLLDLPEEIEASWPFPRVRECGRTANTGSEAARDTALGIRARPENRWPPSVQSQPQNKDACGERAQPAVCFDREGGRTLPTVESFLDKNGGTAGQGPPGAHEEESWERDTTSYDLRRTAGRRSRAVEEARGLSGPARRGRRRV